MNPDSDGGPGRSPSVVHCEAMVRWLALSLSLAGALSASLGCEARIDIASEPPVVDLPPVSLPPVEADRFFAGQRIYDTCHGVFEESEKRGRTAGAITHALATENRMRAFEARLGEEDIGLIAYALAYDPAGVSCPPLAPSFAPAPHTRAVLEAIVVDRLGLGSEDVGEALASYALGYDSSPDFDNQVRDPIVDVNTGETLLHSMENVASLWLTSSEFTDCITRPCAERAFRVIAERLALGPELVTSALEIFAEAQTLGMAEDGLQMGVTRILMSPDLIYDTTRAGSTPQGRMVAALSTRTASSEELERSLESLTTQLLENGGAGVLAERFALRWLGIAQKTASVAAVDPALLPVDPQLIRDLQEEARLDFRQWVLDDGPLSALLVTDTSYVNGRVAAYYGIEGVVGETFERVAMGERGGGLLSRGAVLVASGGSSSTSPVTRGKWMLDHVLCTNLPPLPPDDLIAEVQMRIDDAPGHRTPREHSAARRAVSQCAGCHSVIDEIGFGLEGFDAWGAERTTYDDGDPVETAGTLPGERSFLGHRDMATLLQDSMAFRMCATQKMSQYLLGRPLRFPERCRIRRLVTEFEDEMGAQEWMRRIVGTEVFTSTIGERP